MKKKLLSLLLLLTITTQSLTACTRAEPHHQTVADSNVTEKQFIKEKIKAQDDFYGYVNYESLQKMEIPFGENSNGTLEQAKKKVDEQLDEIIEQIVNSKENYMPGSNEQLVRELYEQCISYEYEGSGAKTQLEQMVQEIESAQNLNELIPVLGKLYTEYGCAVLFQPVVESNAYQSEDNALYAMYFQIACRQDLEGIYEEESNRMNTQRTVQNALYELEFHMKKQKREEELPLICCWSWQGKRILA